MLRSECAVRYTAQVETETPAMTCTRCLERVPIPDMRQHRRDGCVRLTRGEREAAQA